MPSLTGTIHPGPFISIGAADDAILRWTGGNGYRIVSLPREVYVRDAENGSQTDADTVTEIEFPVEQPSRKPGLSVTPCQSMAGSFLLGV